MVYVCEKCSFQSSKWLGQCPECEAWNSFQEDVIEKNPAKQLIRKVSTTPRILSQINTKTEKLQTGITEFDRVLGEGITAGSLTLLSGEPGIGKSTIVLELASKLADQGKKILYISGEESAEQISNRAGRLCIKSENIEITSENALENILHIIDSQNPDFIIVDSIQVIASMNYLR